MVWNSIIKVITRLHKNDMILKWPYRLVAILIPAALASQAPASPAPKDATKPSDLWSLKPIAHPTVPAIASASGSKNPVDAFLLKKLTETGLHQTPPADRRTLIRRVSLVLVGLPPTPEEVEAFVADRSPDAYEKVVDRLLASPHFGERWAQHWLDAVRWAETNGSESNLYRVNAWPYRDYVIKAFNQDIPYNRFLTEQLAGDQLGVDEATGFLVAGPYATPDTVGLEPAAIKQGRYDRLDEIMQSLGASMVGMTLGCARCHNHKFDPITSEDYYSIVSVFQGVEYGPRLWKSQPDAAKKSARQSELTTEMATTRQALGDLVPQWTEDWSDYHEIHFRPTRGTIVRLTFDASPSLDEVEIYGPENPTVNLALASGGAKARSSQPADESKRAVSQLIDGVHDHYHNWNGGVKTGTDPIWAQIELPKAAMIDHVVLSVDRDTLKHVAYLSPTGVRPVPRAVHVDIQDESGNWMNVARPSGPADGGSSGNGKRGKNAGKAKTAETAEAATTAPAVSSPAATAQAPTTAPANGPIVFSPATSPEAAPLMARLAELIKQYKAVEPPPLFAGFFTRPDPGYVMRRGDPTDPREPVKPAALAILGGDLGVSSDAPEAQRRLAFARWLTSPTNPLTARVMVNRLWQGVFGTGIVDTPGDFGNAGSPPTHPELLDWLASDFRDNGWSSKRILRTIVTSNAFCQSSAPDSNAATIDANARLLWRFPPKRLEAEVLRDSMLAACGTLDPTMGGPSFRIHKDKTRFEIWTVTDNYGPATWRRMIYQERMRGVDDCMFTAFDLPDCGQTMPRRTDSTTPLQALNLLNGPLTTIHVQKLAERLQHEAGDDPSAQIRRLFLLTVCREPTEEEMHDCTQVLKEYGLPAVCRAALNLNEFVFVQ